MKTSVLSLLFFISTQTKAQTGLEQNGQRLYEINCAKCHGMDGSKGRFGAKNLQNTILNDKEMFYIITKGKRIMPSWEHRLAEYEILDLIAYLHQLHKTKLP